MRFNKAQVRQVSDVLQMSLSLTLKKDGRESSTTISVSSDQATDTAQCEDCLNNLRKRLTTLEKQPFFVEVTNNGTSHTVNKGMLLSSEEYLEIITSEAKNVDLAGILISGDIAVGNANSKGQYHWFKSTSFCFDPIVSIYRFIPNITVVIDRNRKPKTWGQNNGFILIFLKAHNVAKFS